MQRVETRRSSEPMLETPKNTAPRWAAPVLSRRSICPAADFVRLLKKERSRSDRLHDDLSLIVVETESGSLAKSVARQVAGRIDILEDIGWLDRRTIGVLLPHTEQERAETVAYERFDRILRVPGICISTWTYPGTCASNASRPDRTMSLSRLTDA